MKRTRMKSKPYHSVKSRRGLEDVADVVLSQFVIRRDGHCVLCGATYQLSAGHYYKRRHESVRFHSMNVHCLCFTCNDRDNLDHSDYERFMARTYSADELIALGELKLHGPNLSDDELKDLIKTTREAIREMRTGQHDF